MLMRKCLGRFRRDAKGLAALEFALILPVMLTLVFGLMELELALGARTGVAQIADTVGDLVAQENTVSTADLTNVYNAANTILYPYYPNLSGLKPTIRITSVIYDLSTGTGGGKVQWTCNQTGSGTLNPASRSPGDTVTFTQPLMAANGSVIMAEVVYSYASPTTRVVVGNIPMSSTYYTRPRRVAQLPTPTCPSP